MAFISFIIPAYNEEKYLEACLNSIVNQEGLAQYEIIVVDNASTDNTARIVKAKFPQVKLVYESCKGVTLARNRGAKDARGEFLAFIDADCKLSKDWAGKVLNIFSRKPDVVLISGPYRYDAIPFRWMPVLWHAGEFLFYRLILPANYFIFQTLFKHDAPFMEGNSIVKKEVFEKVGGWNEKITFYGDGVDLSMRLIREGKIFFSPSLEVESSSRRLLAENPFKAVARYVINDFWLKFLGRPFSKTYRDIR